jgi:hypothetical protein
MSKGVAGGYMPCYGRTLVYGGGTVMATWGEWWLADDGTMQEQYPVSHGIIRALARIM